MFAELMVWIASVYNGAKKMVDERLLLRRK